MELADTSVIVREAPWRLAPCELMTASEGIMAFLADWPIVFCAGAAIASWADAACGATTRATNPAQRPIKVWFDIKSFLPGCSESVVKRSA